MSQTPLLALTGMRLHKENFHVYEAKATVQSSLWDSNLHGIWQPGIKMQKLVKSLDAAGQANNSLSPIVPSLHISWVLHFTAFSLALIFLICGRIRLSPKIQMEEKK